MNNDQEKKIRELEERVEKTDERISVYVGAGIAAIAGVMAGVSAPLFVVAGAIGGVAGLGVHHARKWLKKK